MTQIALPPDPPFADAAAVSEFLLEETRAAYQNRDFEALACRFSLPQSMGTFDGERMISTRAELKAIFDAMCDYFESLGVLDLQRKTIAARFINPDRIQATFVSQHVLPGYLLSDEVIAHRVLIRVDGRWLIADGHYATDMPGVRRAMAAMPAPDAPRPKALA